MRLIDADKLKENFTNADAFGLNLELDRYAIKCIDNAPTIVAVDVVRCKDCKTQQTCNFSQYQGNNSFCSLAERKDEVEE